MLAGLMLCRREVPTPCSARNGIDDLEIAALEHATRAKRGPLLPLPATALEPIGTLSRSPPRGETLGEQKLALIGARILEPDDVLERRSGSSSIGSTRSHIRRLSRLTYFRCRAAGQRGLKRRSRVGVRPNGRR